PAHHPRRDVLQHRGELRDHLRDRGRRPPRRVAQPHPADAVPDPELPREPVLGVARVDRAARLPDARRAGPLAQDRAEPQRERQRTERHPERERERARERGPERKEERRVERRGAPLTAFLVLTFVVLALPFAPALVEWRRRTDAEPLHVEHESTVSA